MNSVLRMFKKICRRCLQANFCKVFTLTNSRGAGKRKPSIIKTFAGFLHDDRELMTMMFYHPHLVLRQEATSQFERAQRRAKRRLLRARVFGKPQHLLCLNAFRFRAHGLKRLEYIPLSKIKGSLGRCHDFSDDFLPRHGGLEGRWTQVWQLMRAMKTLPPIEVYEMSGAYFVIDGHHRVSVAKQLGLSHIEALVSDIKELATN